MSAATDNVKEQIRELHRAIQEHTRKLDEVQNKMLLVKEQIIQCTTETERRVDLMMENTGVVDMLQQFGHLLQEEKQLTEQLDGQVTANRTQMQELQERSECIMNKVKSLTAEILEVNQCLTETKTRNIAAQTLSCPLSSKSKRNQRKPK